jgi:hypothetical protein
MKKSWRRKEIEKFVALSMQQGALSTTELAWAKDCYYLLRALADKEETIARLQDDLFRVTKGDAIKWAMK